MTAIPELAEIKFKRKQFSLTQKELSQKSGVSQSLISKIEAGVLIPNFENAKKIFDCLNALKEDSEARAKDIMHRKIYGVKPKESVQTAVRLMTSKGISQMPVLENNHSVGRISERLIVSKIGSRESFGKLSVEEIMEDSMPVVQETTPLSAVTELLKYSSGILVGSKGKVVGIITKTDLLKASIAKKK